MAWRQIVVGNGSSALNFLQSALQGSEQKFKSDEILVIGKTDLWSRTKGSHAMGQPPALLQRQVGDQRPASVDEKPRVTGLPSDKYTSSGGYTEHLGKVRGKLIEALPGKIWGCDENVIGSGIQRNGESFHVTVASGETFDAEQVIVANGIGPPSTLPPLDRAITALSQVHGAPRGYPEIVDAVTYYNSNPPPGLDVIVYGGSATSSWAAYHAWKVGEARVLLWMCRRGIDAISTEGNPVGRNSEVIQMAVTEGLIQAGEIKNIAVNLGATPDEGRLMVELEILGVDRDKMTRSVKGDTVTLTKLMRPDLNRTVTISVHQVVYAVGSNPMGEGGPGHILSAPLRDELLPVYAKDHQFMTGKDDILIAFATPDEKLWIVGAAVFGGVGVPKLAQLKAKYSKVGSFMPAACTPPEGIAILSTTIDALTGHMIDDPAKFDWNRARPDEIANLFKKVYAIDELACKQIAQVLVDKRRDSKFALPRKDIEDAVKELNLRFPNLDVARLRLDRVFPG